MTDLTLPEFFGLKPKFDLKVATNYIKGFKFCGSLISMVSPTQCFQIHVLERWTSILGFWLKNGIRPLSSYPLSTENYKLQHKLEIF